MGKVIFLLSAFFIDLNSFLNENDREVFVNEIYALFYKDNLMAFVFFIIFVTACILCFLFLTDGKKQNLSSLHLKQLEYQIAAALREKNSSQALKLLKPHQKNLIKIFEKNQNILFYCLQALVNNQEWSKASKLVEKTSLDSNKDLRFAPLLGQLYQAQKNYSLALKSFESCRPHLVQNQQFHLLLDVYYQLGQYDQALETYATLEEKGKDSPKDQLLIAHCHFRKNHFQKALEYYQTHHQNIPHSKEALLHMAHCQRHLKNYPQAISLFQKILNTHPLCHSSLMGLGACYEKVGTYHKALKLYRQSPQWSKASPTLFRQAGICCLHLKRYRFAEVYLEKSLKGKKGALSSYLFFAAALEKQGKWLEMEQLYFKLIQDFPHHVSGYRGLAWLFGVGLSVNIDSQMGISMAKKSLELLNNASSWEVLSACEARAGNFVEAHHIQECLSSQEANKAIRRRRQQAMRSLRKKIPLNESQVSHNLVA